MLGQALLVSLVMFFVKTCDHTFGQPLIERPMWCGLLVGLVLGDLQQGIIIGATLELVFLGTITIGGSVPSDLAVGSVLATAFCIILDAGTEVAVALAVPIASLAVFAYQLLKVAYTALIPTYDRWLEEGKDKRALNLVFFLTLFYGVPFTVIAFFAILLGTGVIETLLVAIPPVVMSGLQVAAGILPALGFGILLKTLWSKELAAFFFIGFAITAYLGLPAVAVAIIGGGAAVFMCFQNFELNQKLQGMQASGLKNGSGDDKEDFFDD